MNKTVVQKKTVGLALGSGGWRGQAHIGVIKALVAHGIRIDAIAGTSSGAMVGGAYCALGDAQLLEQAFREHITKKSMLYAFSDPWLKAGMFKGERLTKVFETLSGKHLIENLAIPFCAVSTDLLSGSVVEIKTGDLSQAIRASTSIPFVFEPVHYGKHRLIDGGTAVPVPVKTARQMGVDVVIAVNLYKNIFPVKASKMSSLRSLGKTTQIMMYHLAAQNCMDADLVIQPNIPEEKDFSDPFTGFISKRDIIDCGVASVEEQIEKIRELVG